MPIPVTILGGYLGAGKTTLINRILAQQTPSRLAIFVNDFGEVNIDAALIETQTDNVVSLTNGCVCCSIGDDLGKALFDLLENDQMTDHIVIEASGAADPARIGGYASGDTRLGVPTVITLADAETVQGRAKDKFVGKLVKRQLASAQVIALSKTDLVASEKVVDVFQWVGTIAAATPIVKASDLDDLFINVPSSPASAGDTHGLPHFKTFSFKTDLPLERAPLEKALGELPEAIWRAKGFVRFTDGTNGLVQKVGTRTEISPTEQLRKDTVLVFISPSDGVNPEEICSKLHTCCQICPESSLPH